jgi:hypothetical protein
MAGHAISFCRQPDEEAKMQMFIWNNISFSLGFDMKDHYKDLGGDAAAHVAPRNDLQGVKVYNAVDLEGLFTLGTMVLEYRGYRVTAQSIIPGILEREADVYLQWRLHLHRGCLLRPHGDGRAEHHNKEGTNQITNRI